MIAKISERLEGSLEMLRHLQELYAQGQVVLTAQQRVIEEFAVFEGVREKGWCVESP